MATYSANVTYVTSCPAFAAAAASAVAATASSAPRVSDDDGDDGDDDDDDVIVSSAVIKDPLEALKVDLSVHFFCTLFFSLFLLQKYFFHVLFHL